MATPQTSQFLLEKPDEGQSHADAFSGRDGEYGKSGEREKDIRELARHFYYDERATLVSNGLSTELLIFPSDLEPSHKPDLEKKIQRAINYATEFEDIEELNALRYMAPKGERNDYSALGLYLYFADECSRKHCDISFLTALRDSGVSLKAGEGYIRGKLLHDFMKALKRVGMDESHGHIAQEWFDKGSFTIEGDPARGIVKDLNGYDKDKKENFGAYARLGELIGFGQKVFGLNNAISYALANKQTMENMHSGADALKHTRTLTAGLSPGSLHENVIELIEQGKNKREDNIWAIISELKPPSWSPAREIQKRNAGQMAEAVLKSLPDKAIELLINQEPPYTLAYTNAPNIRNSYPEEDLPGVPHENNEVSRSSKALRSSRYHVIYFGNGPRRNPGDIEKDPALRNMVFKQSLLHELMHIAIGQLNKNEEAELFKAALAVCNELEEKDGKLPAFFHLPLKTMDVTNLDHKTASLSLREMADIADNQYNGYTWEERRCEVACNMYALLHTEYPRHASGDNPYTICPKLAEFADMLETFVGKAVERSAEDKKQMQTPNDKAKKVVVINR